MLYSTDYYLLLQECINHPIKSTLSLIGFGIVLYLLHLLDKRIEERKMCKSCEKRKQCCSQKVHHHEQ